jgi:hypothetical protein
LWAGLEESFWLLTAAAVLSIFPAAAWRRFVCERSSLECGAAAWRHFVFLRVRP